MAGVVVLEPATVEIGAAPFVVPYNPFLLAASASYETDLHLDIFDGTPNKAFRTYVCIQITSPLVFEHGYISG